MNIEIENEIITTKIGTFKPGEVIGHNGKVYCIVDTEGVKIYNNVLDVDLCKGDNIVCFDLSNGKLVLFHKDITVKPVKCKLTCKFS